MAVSHADIRSWTTPGAQDAAQATYAAVQNALKQSRELAGVNYEVFLQGSYANATNTRGDSDVDIVVKLESTFRRNIDHLSAYEKASYIRDSSPARVTSSEFRRMVHEALNSYFGYYRVSSKDKCIRVEKKDGYVDADVVPALEYRLYKSYASAYDNNYIEGIAIDPLSGGQIVNYPKEHKKNGSRKNSTCGTLYKPTVRQVKRLRRLAVSQGLVRKESAPGYLLECLVYNVPTENFLYDDVARLYAVVGWLKSHSAASLASICKACDEVHYLFKDDPGNHNEYITEDVLNELWKIL